LGKATCSAAHTQIKRERDRALEKGERGGGGCIFWLPAKMELKERKRW